MRILLVCSTGLSTSLIVNKMIDASKQMDRNDYINAICQSDITNKISNYDVVLLGPQMKFLQPKIEPKAKSNSVKFGVIPTNIYAKANGKEILNFAIKILSN